MKESIWGYAVIVLGVFTIGIIWFLANVTRTDQHNYNLLKETVEAAMLDAVDLSAYRYDETIRIDEQKFVENFIRRFAESADLTNEYQIDIYDISEEPPKVSLRVSSRKAQSFINPKNENQTFEFDVVNYIDAVLEAKFNNLQTTSLECVRTTSKEKKAFEIYFSSKEPVDLNKIYFNVKITNDKGSFSFDKKNIVVKNVLEYEEGRIYEYDDVNDMYMYMYRLKIENSNLDLNSEYNVYCANIISSSAIEKKESFMDIVDVNQF